MPSSGNKLKSQLGTEKFKWAENLGYTDVSWEPSKAHKPFWASRDTVQVSKKQAQHSTELPRRPQRPNYVDRNQIKVRLLGPSMYCSLLLEQSSNAGYIVLGDSGASPKNKVWKRKYKEKNNWVGIIYSEEKSEYNFKCFQGS